MLGLMFNKVWVYALLGLFVLGFLYRIYKAGSDAEKLDQLEREFNAVVVRNKIEDDVSRMSDSRVIEQLRKHGWIRDTD